MPVVSHLRWGGGYIRVVADVARCGARGRKREGRPFLSALAADFLFYASDLVTGISSSGWIYVLTRSWPNDRVRRRMDDEAGTTGDGWMDGWKRYEIHLGPTYLFPSCPSLLCSHPVKLVSGRGTPLLSLSLPWVSPGLCASRLDVQAAAAHGGEGDRETMRHSGHVVFFLSSSLIGNSRCG